MAFSKKQKEPLLLTGDFAVWIFVFAELLVFAVFFMTYAVVRAKNVDLFNQFQLTLNKETGAINTILLITASYFVVLAIRFLKKNNPTRCYQLLFAALFCGGAFVGIKTYEFNEKFSHGIDMSTNDFYFFYFALTIFHYLHVILGMLILFVLAIKTKKGVYTSTNTNGIESGAVYWHMVDLVWIILFPLIYIIR